MESQVLQETPNRRLPLTEQLQIPPLRRRRVLTQTGRRMFLLAQVGTPAWMAPEVLRGDEYTSMADIYSFGVIVWEIVHRAEPLKGVNQFAVAIQVGVEGRR